MRKSVARLAVEWFGIAAFALVFAAVLARP
jgi:hypothetical protein